MKLPCPEQSKGTISKWVKDTGMMDIGESIIEAMVEAKLVEDPADLYLLLSAELTQMPFRKSMFGAKRAGKTIASINGKKTLPLNTFLGALGISGLDVEIARNIRETKPGFFDNISDWIEGDKLLEYRDAIGLKNIAENIHEGLHAKRPLIAKLLRVGVTISNPVAPTARSGASGPP